MYWGCYCKTGSCGQFHVVSYIGLTSETTFVKSGGGGIPHVPAAELPTDTTALISHPLRVTHFLRHGNRGFDRPTRIFFSPVESAKLEVETLPIAFASQVGSSLLPVSTSKALSNSKAGCTGFARMVKVYPFFSASASRSLVSVWPEKSKILQFGLFCVRRMARSIP